MGLSCSTLNLLFITTSQNPASQRWYHPKDCRWFHVETGSYLKLEFLWRPTGVKYGCISLGNVTHPSAHLCTSCDVGAAVCSLWELCVPVYRNHRDEMSSDQEQRWASENTCEEEAAAEELLGGKSGGDWRHRKELMHALHRAGKIWSQLRNKFRPRTEGRRKYSLLPAWSGELGWWSYSNMLTLSLFSNFFLHVCVFIV